MLRPFVRNIELWLSAAGLIVIAVVPLLLADVFPNRWMTAAITAAGVGVLHGFIFWLVHRRQRRVRHGTIVQVKAMLRDLINNKLAVAVLAGELGERVDLAVTAEEISRLLDDLDEDALKSWTRMYPDATPPI